MKTKSLKIALAGVAVMSLIAGACGGSDEAATEEAVTEETADIQTFINQLNNLYGT